jgi:hypothetical protein
MSAHPAGATQGVGGRIDAILAEIDRTSMSARSMSTLEFVKSSYSSGSTQEKPTVTVSGGHHEGRDLVLHDEPSEPFPGLGAKGE